MSGNKFDEGKLRYDLIPVVPLRRLAEVFTIGAQKYGDRNWEKGLVFGRVSAALDRHHQAWKGGENLDPDNGQHHLASVAWCALVLMELEDTWPELDDRPDGRNLSRGSGGTIERKSENQVLVPAVPDGYGSTLSYAMGFAEALESSRKQTTDGDAYWKRSRPRPGVSL